MRSEPPSRKAQGGEVWVSKSGSSNIHDRGGLMPGTCEVSTPPAELDLGVDEATLSYGSMSKTKSRTAPLSVNHWNMAG
eukprot:CAMPEP_0183354242 /NCGR_PEP_ID=MMETSP0164_2-20130417/37196_1 /TAXON_ID=221442 /ORGANISM="Coccolithus pelagicus ssp braarudi, Strain PLY182g" /LENGTH=78 /DNA_ID=CAMNT_0025527093 /DNA_START=282 /DNA_END=518 /DNA_ORIENTATION=+